MKKTISILAFLGLISVQSQVISSKKWKDWFSYNNVLQIREDNGKLIAATENGVFFYTPASGEITKLSKANGLHEVKISAFDFNPETKVGLVGYANGTMDVITEEGIIYVVDIPISQSYTGDKKIKHIAITGKYAAITVEYGVSVFDLEKKEFKDTAFFPSGTVPKESVIKDNQIFVVTNTEIKKHTIENNGIADITFPIYTSWETALAGSFNHIDIQNGVIAYAGSNTAGYSDGVTFNNLSGTFTNIKDVVVADASVLIVDEAAPEYKVYSYNTAGSLLQSHNFAEALNTAWQHQDQLFAGSQISGILDQSLKIWKADGPFHNQSYKIHLFDDKILVASGGTDIRHGVTTIHPLTLGIYYFNGKQWIYPQWFLDNHNATTDKMRFNVIGVTANPVNKKEIFFSTFNGWANRAFNGFYKMELNETDAEFIRFYPTSGNHNTGGVTYDDKGNLFGVGAFDNVGSPVMYLYDRNGDALKTRTLPGTADKNTLANLTYYEGKLWTAVPRKNNFIITNTQNTPTNLADDNDVVLNRDANNLPASGEGTTVVAFGKNDEVWLGTDKGLRVFSSASQLDGSTRGEPIIIEQQGLGEELFRDSGILQIAVDSGNQKWVSVNGGGVFYLSANGQQTIHHFTKENSPLPNNAVTDIKIDANGLVYFATSEGIVTYQGDVAKVSENFGDVLVYPNPVVYSTYKGNVRIKGLAEKTNIRITDAAGNLVHQAVARGGYYDWDLTNRGKRVASGIYFVLMTNENGTDKATAKIAVVN